MKAWPLRFSSASSQSRVGNPTDFTRYAPPIVLAAILGAAAWGWINRHSTAINPDSGLGYALGIVGVTMMLALLIYPIRKVSSDRFPGSIGFWFQVHMLLGLLGPLAILFHSRFTYSAPNSGVALISMLVVVGSGLVGRYLHSHVHRNYSIRRFQVGELLDEIVASRAELDADGDAGEAVRERLAKYQQLVLHPPPGVLASAAVSLRLELGAGWRDLAVAHTVAAQLARSASDAGWTRADLRQHQRDARLHVHRYLRAIRMAGTFAFYDRLFSLWRILHLPLFAILGVAIVIHVIAVHMY